jgi:hypothetical protein
MSSTTICSTSQVNYRPSHNPLPQNSATKANAGINEVIPVERTSNEQEQLAVQKLTEALKVQPDQTTVLVSAM